MPNGGAAREKQEPDDRDEENDRGEHPGKDHADREGCGASSSRDGGVGLNGFYGVIGATR
jgi:hypothetical protein